VMVISASCDFDLCLSTRRNIDNGDKVVNENENLEERAAQCRS
jgi:hypothetical protein